MPPPPPRRSVFMSRPMARFEVHVMSRCARVPLLPPPPPAPGSPSHKSAVLRRQRPMPHPQLPLQDCLVDKPGMLAYLQRKIRAGLCLACSEHTKFFPDVYTLRRHMVCPSGTPWVRWAGAVAGVSGATCVLSLSCSRTSQTQMCTRVTYVPGPGGQGRGRCGGHSGHPSNSGSLPFPA